MSNRFITRYLFLVLTLVVLFSSIYIAIQQGLRLSANDPQVQIAEDLARQIDQNTSAFPAFQEAIELETSLAPFVIIFDQNETPLSSSVVLNGQIPKPPAGVFDYARKHGRNLLTWEPETDLRIAMVLKKNQNGFVLAGRSLREVEARTSQIGRLLLVGWLTCLVFSTIFYFLEKKSRKEENNNA